MTPKILIIDDHPETLSIIERVLSQQGYIVLGVRSALRGLSLAETELPDLILVDGMMPEIDGWEVCRRVRANDHLAHIPIIMFSAVSEAEQKLAGFNAGADDYLTKPTEPEELVSRVKAMLETAASRAPQKKNGDSAPLPRVQTTDPSPAKGSAVTLPPGKTTSLPLDKSVIAVLGARGGAGATTLAINLAAASADAGAPTTLVDLDLVQGHVALYLKQKVSGGVQQLANLPADAFKPYLTGQATQYSKNLRLVLAQANLFHQRHMLSSDQTIDLLAALAKLTNCVVVDLGHAGSALAQPVIEQATQVVLCLRPERVALSASRKLLTEWQKTLPGRTSSLNVVMIDFSGGRATPKQAIESFLGYPLTAVLIISPQELTQAVNKGVPLVHLFPQSQTAVSFQHLARRLVATVN